MATDSAMNGHGGGVPLDAAQATITTCNVSVHVIRIGKRQLTQSVFRQLPTRRLINEDIPVLCDGAVIWGWVNYLCEGGHKPRQFIVQYGDKLYRCKEHVVRSNKFGEESRGPYSYYFVPSGYEKMKKQPDSFGMKRYAKKWDAIIDQLESAEQLYIAT